MSCLECGEITDNPKFCTRSCAAKYNNRTSPKRKTRRRCLKCDSLVDHWSDRYCQQHIQEREDNHPKNKTIGEYRLASRLKGHHPTSTHASIRGLARSWLKHLRELPCARCGYDKHVELAHIKAVTEFPDEALLSEVNCETNVIQLCPNCHWEFDNLPREQFFPS